MGQTLNNGVYLPDEGERNAYPGLESNWRLLDGLIPTIDGKAGLNTANTWAGLNTYSIGQIKIQSLTQEVGVIPQTSTIQYLELVDKNNEQHGLLGLWDYNNGASEIQINIRDKFSNGAKDPNGTSDTAIFSFGFQPTGVKFITFSGQLNNGLIPLSNNAYPLGSSAYQWSAVYAQTYYYNGTAWGLDKANIWTGANTFKSPNTNLTLQSTTSEMGSLTASSNWFRWIDKNGAQNAYISRDVWSDGADSLRIAIVGKRANGAPSTGGTEVDCGVRLNLEADGTKSFTPFDNNINLGTSTNKWKTLNGINPGALSLPTTDTSKLVYFNGDITDLTGGLNSKAFSAPGWITLLTPNVSGDFIAIDTSIGQVVSISGTGVGDINIACICPVRAGVTNKIFCKCSGGSITAAFCPCSGNV